MDKNTYNSLSDDDKRTVDLIREERQRRIGARYRMQNMGVQPARIQHVYRVQTQAIEIPEWARKFSPAGFPSDRDLVWLGRSSGSSGRGARMVAKMLIQMDRDSGGASTLGQFEAYQCPSCKKWALGLNARDLAHRVELGRVAEASGAGKVTVICGVHCTADEPK